MVVFGKVLLLKIIKNDDEDTDEDDDDDDDDVNVTCNAATPPSRPVPVP